MKSIHYTDNRDELRIYAMGNCLKERIEKLRKTKRKFPCIQDIKPQPEVKESKLNIKG